MTTCTRPSCSLNTLWPVIFGRNQYVAAMNVNATAVPTVRWKWPTIHSVLWTR